MSRSSSLILTAALFGAPALAAAHSYSIFNGTLVAGGNHFRVELVVPLEDVVHCQRVLPHENGLAVDELRRACERHQADILDHFILRDDEGERLTGKATSVQVGFSSKAFLDYPEIREQKIRYRFEYISRRPVSFLTLQQTLYSDGPSLFSRLSLRIQYAGSEKNVVVDLTNGGNVEVVDLAELRGNARFHGEDEPTGGDRFKSVWGVVRHETDGVNIELQMPLAILETWISIPRSRPEVLEPDEQSTGIGVIREFLVGRNRIEINGAEKRAQVERIEFAGPDGGSSTGRLNAWSARVRVSLKYSTETAPTKFRLRWDLFNSLILDAKVILRDGAHRSEHRLTTYQPTLEWVAPR